MRGDDPCSIQKEYDHDRFAPHARGRSVGLGQHTVNDVVCPACAGMIRSGLCCSLNIGCLPRMRGDDPATAPTPWPFLMFAPHARG